MPADMDIVFYILVPVYKVEKYIHECIASVLNQSYQKFKLVLVDDGTPDASGKICDEYAEKDERLHVIHQPNRGQLAAREAALHYIQSAYSLENAYVMFLDSDDSLKRNALEKLAAILQKNHFDMVIYGMDRVANGQILCPFNKRGMESFLEEDKRRLYKRVFSNSEYNAVWRKAIRADLIPEKDYTKYYKFFHAEDLLRSIDMYKAVSKVYFLQESLYNYTINPNSITQTVDASNYKVDFTIREKVLEFLREEDIFTEEDWREYRGFCVSLITDAAKTIGSFTVSGKRKRELYDKIAASDFYRQSLKGKTFKSGRKTRLLFGAFEKRMYGVFDAYGSLRRTILSIRNYRKTYTNRGGENK